MWSGRQDVCGSWRDLGGWDSQIWGALAESFRVKFALTPKTDIKPSLKVRVCPARTQWGGWFINNFCSLYAN